jgi:hypothetical protein
VPTLVADNYSGGVVPFTSGVLSALPGSAGVHLRVCYRAQSDWGLAVYKSPFSYMPGAPATQAATYSIAGNTLQFPVTDLGKLVQISGVLGSDGHIYNDGQLWPIGPGGTVSLSGVLPSGVNITSVNSILGASVMARVVWKERSQWRHRDVTSLIVPIANRSASLPVNYNTLSTYF